LRLCREVKTATGLTSDPEGEHERDYRAMAYLFTLQEIIEKMQRLKHGGCILIVPEVVRRNNSPTSPSNTAARSDRMELPTGQMDFT